MRRTIFALFLLAAAANAPAGECRARLRPLLSNPAPDAQALDEVRTLCEQEAEAGSADAHYQLALFHLGLAGVWEPDVAVPMIRDAASQGVPEAQYWLAWQYEAGSLLPHDEAAAREWYQRAANANHRLAVGRLAEAYESGELGLPRDPLLAAQYKARQSQCARKQAATKKS
jgi:TPR repeat protein